MRISRLAALTIALALLVGGFAAGRIVTSAESPPRHSHASDDPGNSIATNETRPPQTFPVSDVDGADFDDLPRYPGSLRTRYRPATADGASTRVEYLAQASVEEVSRFYRAEFNAHGWRVVDVQIAYGEIVYLLERGDVDGAVDIESRGDGVVEIDLEVVRPAPAAGSPPPDQTVGPPPSSTAPPSDPPPLPTDDDPGDEDGDG